MSYTPGHAEQAVREWVVDALEATEDYADTPVIYARQPSSAPRPSAPPFVTLSLIAENRSGGYADTATTTDEDDVETTAERHYTVWRGTIQLSVFGDSAKEIVDFLAAHWQLASAVTANLERGLSITGVNQMADITPLRNAQWERQIITEVSYTYMMCMSETVDTVADAEFDGTVTPETA